MTRTSESPYLEFYVSKEYLINVACNSANVSISVCITREYSLLNSVISLNLILCMASIKVLLRNVLSHVYWTVHHLDA